MKPGDIIERNGKKFIVMGKTFSTSEKLNPGDHFSLESETINFVKSEDGKIVGVTAWVPNFIEKSQEKLDTVESLTKGAEAHGILQGKVVKPDGTIEYLPTHPGEASTANKGMQLVLQAEKAHTGAMLALYPDTPPTFTLQDPDLTPTAPDELHVTMAYLGDAADLDEEDRGFLRRVCEQIASEFNPIQAKLGGIGRFLNVEDDDTQAYYASVDSPDIEKLRARLVEVLGALGMIPENAHGFTPHMTLAYVPVGKPAAGAGLQEEPVEFGGLSLSLGGEREEFPFQASGAKQNIMLTYPDENKTQRFVWQQHFRGKSAHGDFRVQSGDYLVGWTIPDQSPGAIAEPVETLAQATTAVNNPDLWKMNLKTGEIKPREIRSGVVRKGDLRALPKGVEIPEDWLNEQGVTDKSDPGEAIPVGATRNYPGVFKIVDKGTVEHGAKKSWMAEYFIHGDKWGDQRWVFRLLEREKGNGLQAEGWEEEAEEVKQDTLPPGVIEQQPRGATFWVFMQPDDQTPYVLGKEAVDKDWLPPKGVSALPKAIRERVPKDLRYWEVSGQEALDRRAKLAEMDVRELGGSSAKYSPNQPRDESGRFGSGGSTLSGEPKRNTASVHATEKARTGEHFSAELYRGTGQSASEAARNRTPSQYAVGEYWSPYPEVAETYGPKVSQNKLTLENPYVFKLPGKKPYFTELQSEFGTRKPEEITRKLKSQGHDGLIVKNVPVNRFSTRTNEPVAFSDSIEVIAFKSYSEAKQLDWHPYKLQRRYFRGPIQVRFGASEQFYDLWLDQAGKPWHLVVEGNPLTNDRLPAYEENYNPTMATADGKKISVLRIGSDPVELAPGQPANPTKDTPAFIQTVDEGETRVLDSQPEFTKLEFKGGKLKGAWYFRLEEAGSQIGEFGKSEGPQVGAKYEPGQARDDVGRFASGGGASGGLTSHADGISADYADSLSTELDSWDGDRQGIAQLAVARGSVGQPFFEKREDGKLKAVMSMEKELSEDWPVDGKFMKISNLATAERGHGAGMVRDAAKEAASRKVGLYLESAPGAKGFYQKLGMNQRGDSFWFTPEETARFAGEKATLAESEPADGVFTAKMRKGEKGVRPLFGSPGGKRLLAKTIVDLIPPHKVYVEPFAGGAAVLFSKPPEMSEKEVLADADPDIAFAYRTVKGLSDAEIERLNGMEWRIGKFDEVKDSRPDGKLGKLHRWWFLRRFSQGALGESQNQGQANVDRGEVARSGGNYTGSKAEHVPIVRDRLKSVQVRHNDYRDSLKEWDGKETFFYLDPPYPATNLGSSREELRWEDEDCAAFASAVKKLKGKWLVSLQDNQTNRDLFKGYSIRTVSVPTVFNTGGGKGNDRRELLIANYPLPKRVRRKSMDEIEALQLVYTCSGCKGEFESEVVLGNPRCPGCADKALTWRPYLLQRHNEHHDLRIGDDFTLRLSGTLLDNEPDQAEVSTESPTLQGADGQAVDALKVKPGDPVKLSDGEIQTMDKGQARYAKVQQGHQVEFKGGKLEGVYLFGPEGAHPIDDLEHIDVEWEPGQPEPAPAEPEGDHPPLFPFEPPPLINPDQIRPFNPPPPNIPGVFPPPGVWHMGDGEVAIGWKITQPSTAEKDVVELEEGEKFSPGQARDQGGRWAGGGGGGGGVSSGHSAATSHKVGKEDEQRAVTKVGDAAEAKERAKYEMHQGPLTPQWKDEWILSDTTRKDSAGISKTLKEGPKASLEKEVDKRAKTARTRTENNMREWVSSFNRDLENGFYDDAPEGAKKDRERILKADLSDPALKSFDEMDDGAKVGKRIKTEKLSKLQELRSSLESAVKWLGEVIGWASYDDKPEPSMLDFFKGSDAGFTVKTVRGEPWLFTWSANAFKDREGEIFSTKALETWADRASERDDKGTYNFWHIPGSDFAVKKWVGVPGRFLVEAGPFTHDAKGKAAQAFFAQYPDRHPTLAPEGWGCSVEYRYLPEERRKGVYQNVEITRTSVLPRFAAANTWTAVKEVTMALTDAQKKAAQELFGEDLAASILGEAEAKTKELEPNVAHKGEGEPTPPDAPEVPPEAEQVAPVESEDDKAKKKPKDAVPPDGEPYPKPTKAEKKQLDQFVKAIRDVAASVTDDSPGRTAILEVADKLSEENLKDMASELKKTGKAVKNAAQKARLTKLVEAMAGDGTYPAPGEDESYPYPTKSKEFVEEVAAEIAKQFKLDTQPIGEALTATAAALKGLEDRMAVLEQASGRKAATDLPRFVFGLVEQASKADSTIVPEGDKLLDQKPKEAALAQDGSMAAHFFVKPK